MEFYCANATTYPPYDTSDVHRGICRVNKSDLIGLGAKLGFIVHLRLIFDSTITCDVLCTLWSSESYLDDGIMIVDDTVKLCGNSPPDWTDCKSKVISIQPQLTCSSLQLHQSRATLSVDSKGVDLASIFGLAIRTGCTITLNDNSVVTVSRINGAANLCVVSSSTILLRSASTHTANSVRDDTSTSQGETFSNIRVVQDLIERVVYPAAYLPSFVQYKGIMLLGPPGVGKTFAVRAVQHLCKSWCRIHLLELSVPELLAHPSPLARLDAVLETVGRLRKQKIAGVVVSDDFSSVASPSPRSPTPSTDPSKAILGTPVSVRTPIRYTPGVRTPQSSVSASSTKFVHQTPGSGSFAAMLAANSNKKRPAAVTPCGPTTASVDSSASAVDELAENSLYFPELVFVVIDEIDSLGKGGVQSEMQMAIKNRLCRWLDSMNVKKSNPSHSAASVRCCVLATSNRAEDIDLSFRRGGRLEHEIVVLTSPSDRRTLLQSLLTRSFLGLAVPGQANQLFHQDTLTAAAAVIAERSGGYVSADLVALVREMVSRLTQVDEPLPIIERYASSPDAARDLLSLLFEQAARVVPPSCLRGVSIQLPTLSYDDVIGYEEVKRSLRRVLAFSSPEMMTKIRRFGLGAPGGVLLHGPPGNSKTRLVMAAAAHHGLPVISLSSADIFSPYVGDAEAEIRKAFRTARQARPCVLFIDELDSIVTNRETGGGGSSSGVEGRVLATLLTEMDGIQGDDDRGSGGAQSNSGGVIVLGATNRLDFIDAALIRKGRFHHVLFVPLPNESERKLILQYFAKKCDLDEQVTRDLLTVVTARVGLSGADIENLCREAVLMRFKNATA